MLARNEVIFKWLLYSAVALLCIIVQSAILQRITIWGVIPFVYPLLAAIPATFESSVSGTAFALGVGVFCDLLLPVPIPCFFTLIFPLAGLCSALLSQGVLRTGFLCSIAVTATAFALTDFFHCLLLWIQGNPAWAAGFSVFLREFLVSLPLVFPVTFLFRWVYQKVHMDD